jgi:hypothetical protein
MPEEEKFHTLEWAQQRREAVNGLYILTTAVGSLGSLAASAAMFHGIKHEGNLTPLDTTTIKAGLSTFAVALAAGRAERSYQKYRLGPIFKRFESPRATRH